MVRSTINENSGPDNGAWSRVLVLCFVVGQARAHALHGLAGRFSVRLRMFVVMRRRELDVDGGKQRERSQEASEAQHEVNDTMTGSWAKREGCV